MRRIQLMFAGLVVMAAVALAACGGSSSASTGSSFCDLVKKYGNDKALNSGPSSFADIKKQAGGGKSAADRLAAAAPPEIKSDMQTIRQGFAEWIKGVKSAKNFHDMPQIGGSDGSEQQHVYESALSRVATYSKEQCGVQDFVFGN